MSNNSAQEINKLKLRIAELEEENLSLIEEAEQSLHVRIIDEKLSGEKTEDGILNSFTESLATFNSFIYVAYYSLDNKILSRKSYYSLDDQLILKQNTLSYTEEIKNRLESLDGYIEPSSLSEDIKLFLPDGEEFTDTYLVPVYSNENLKGVIFVANNDQKANILHNNVSAIAMTISVLEQRLLQCSDFKNLEDEVSLRTQELRADIEQRKIAESKLSLHVKQTPLGVIEWNKQFEVVAWNPAAEDIFGFKESEALGKHATEIILPDIERKAVDEIWQSLLAQKGGARSTNINITKDKKFIDCDWYNTPLVNKNNEVVGVASLVQDVTFEHRQQELLLHAKQDADKANKAKSEFLAKMSHELRTPMHGILSFANFGLQKSKGTENDKIPYYFKQIDDSAKRLMRLLNDLLDLSKLEAGKVKLDYVEQSFLEIINTVIQEQQLRLDDRNIRIIWGLQADKVNFEFDKPTMIQVITNLFSNAIKFNKPNEPIHIKLTNQVSENGVAEFYFSMRDHGVGVPENELEFIFQPFDQSSHTTNVSGGTGLGLPICKEIIEAHHGSIWVENHPSGGAVFNFCLPLKQPVEQEN